MHHTRKCTFTDICIYIHFYIMYMQIQYIGIHNNQNDIYIYIYIYIYIKYILCMSYVYIGHENNGIIYRAFTTRIKFHRFLFKVIKKVAISSFKPLGKRNFLIQQDS